MKIVGCDFHPRWQQVAVFETETGEINEYKLMNGDGEAERFYRELASPALVGVEACGNSQWFLDLLRRLGHEVWIGDAAEIRASYVRKQKTDRRDANHILKLLLEKRFPRLWVPTVEQRDLRQLLIHRHKLVEIRTRVKNGLQHLAMNRGLQQGSRLCGVRGRAVLKDLPLEGWAGVRRDDGPPVGGNANYSFNLSSLPAAEFTTIQATWTVDGAPSHATYNYHIRVNGVTHLTQYNTPREIQCSGSQQPDTIYNNSCQVTNGSLISGFIFRVTNPVGGTGTGQSIKYGGVRQEFYCPGYSSTSLRDWQTITGKLGPLSNTTVAVCKSGPDAVANARIYIQGTGVKTVTNYCNACCKDLPHYDNYNTSPQCSKLNDLPSAITVRIC